MLCLCLYIQSSKNIYHRNKTRIKDWILIILTEKCFDWKLIVHSSHDITVSVSKLGLETQYTASIGRLLLRSLQDPAQAELMSSGQVSHRLGLARS